MRKPNPIATRPVRRGPPPLRRYTGNVFARLAKKADFVDPNLVSRWEEIAGAEFAGLCLPGRMIGGNFGGIGGKTLEVFAANGAAAARVQFEAEALRAKVNDYMGPGAVARIVVRQTGAKTSEKPGDQDFRPRSGQSGARGAASAPLEGALGRFRSSVSARKNAKDPDSNGQ